MANRNRTFSRSESGIGASTKARTLVVDRPVLVLEGCEPEPETESGMAPRLDMFEEDDELLIKADLPGVQKGDLELNITDNAIHISARKMDADVSQKASYFICERCLDVYNRTVSLPFHVDTTRAWAKLQNGLLEVHMPKGIESKARRLDIKTD